MEWVLLLLLLLDRSVGSWKLFPSPCLSAFARSPGADLDISLMDWSSVIELKEEKEGERERERETGSG